MALPPAYTLAFFTMGCVHENGLEESASGRTQACLLTLEGRSLAALGYGRMQHSDTRSLNRDTPKLSGQIVDPALTCSGPEELETLEYLFTCCTTLGL